LNTKTLNRIGFISNNALRQVLISLFNMVIPFMVIHYSSKAVWGSFVSPLLFSLLVLQIVNWGNKEYLLRQFSQSPNKINFNYSQTLCTRLPLVLVFGAVGLLWFPASFGIFILLWILGRFLSHSAEVLIIYEKEFSHSIFIELGTFALFSIPFFILRHELDVFLLLVIYSLYQFAKGLCYFVMFHAFVSVKNLKIDLSFYKSAFPFFLLSILGFLASKIDVYLIEYLGNKTMTADYQVINSLLVFVMTLSAFIYAPFTKNIYRNNAEVIDKTKQILWFSGLLIVPISFVFIYLILKYYLQLQLPLAFYAVAFIYVFPSFLYGIEIVNLFRRQKEKLVVWYLFIGAASNWILSALFLYSGYGIFGALTGSAIAQLIVLVLLKSGKYFEK
jgi:O-antigen/teichoic acid export membrane protein